jgi:hypothetical protein
LPTSDARPGAALTARLAERQGNIGERIIVGLQRDISLSTPNRCVCLCRQRADERGVER